MSPIPLGAPGVTLVLIPGEKAHREILFAPDHDLAKETYTGAIAEPAALTSTSGIGEIVSNSKFDAFLKAAFENLSFGVDGPGRYFSPPATPNFSKVMKDGDAELFLLFDRAAGANKDASHLVDRFREKYPEVRFRDATPIITKLREIKSSAELKLIQRAIDITLEAQKTAMRRAKTATHEYQVQAAIEFTFRDKGADGWGYPSIVGSGVNTTTLHYESDNAKMDPNGLMLCDVGAELDHYTADITHTFPRKGVFSKEQKDIYEAVYRTSRNVMSMYKSGTMLKDIYEKSFALIGKELLALGLVTKADNADQVKLYYMHGLGHPMGMDVHDIYDRERTLAPSMVVTDEPGIYVNAARIRAGETWKKMSEADRKAIEPALKMYDGIGVRIEDDILVTSGEPINLSAKLPRTVEEIEKFMESF
jgi:Xaa-Pro aminopeptidase